MPVDGDKVQFHNAVRPEFDGGFETNGMHGCFRSHLQVLRESRDAGLARVVIVEDDLQLSRRFREFEERLVDQLYDSPWDIAYFGHRLSIASPEPMMVPYPAAEGISCLHFVGINASVFDPLIELMEGILTRPPGHPDGGPMPPDGAVTTLRARNPHVVTLVASPSVGFQRSSRTDAHPLRWFDRMPLVKDAVGVLRQYRVWVRSLES
jgi:hypothetical protein